MVRPDQVSFKCEGALTSDLCGSDRSRGDTAVAGRGLRAGPGRGHEEDGSVFVPAVVGPQ